MHVAQGHRPLRFLGNVDERHADDPGFIVPEHFLQGRVGLEDAPLPVGQRDTDGRISIQPLPAAFRYLQGEQTFLQRFSAFDQAGSQFADIGSLGIELFLQDIDRPLDGHQVAHPGAQFLR